MKDDTHDGCGYGITFRGWMKKVCAPHDDAYLQGSDAQKWLSRYDVDRAFLRDALNQSRMGQFKFGKRMFSYLAYGVVRLVGGIFWEGKR